MGRPTQLLNPHTTRNRAHWLERLDWLRKNREEKKRDRRSEYRARDYVKDSIRFKAWLQDLRKKAFDILGGPKCVQCGFSDIRALQFDHIRGGEGRKDRIRLKHVVAVYRDVLQQKNAKYQVLCANCNTIKRIVEREWGKAKEVE